MRLFNLTSRSWFLVPAVIGTGLLLLNLYGLHDLPDRHPKAMSYAGKHKNALPHLTHQQMLEALSKVPKTSDYAYLQTVNRIFASGIVRHWPNTYDSDAALTFKENWVIAGLSQAEYFLVQAGLLDRYRFALAERRGWETIASKGIGFCSQIAFAVSDYLGDQNIETQMVGLDGHVIAQAKIANRKYLLDPDYNVVMPFGIRKAETDQALVSSHYQQAKYPKSKADSVAKIYGEEGNRVGSSDSYHPSVAAIFYTSEILKWLIPVLLIGLGLFGFYRQSPRTGKSRGRAPA